MEDKTKQVTVMESYFDGGLVGFIVLQITNLFITLLSIGIAYPYVIARSFKWEVEHTVINGKRLKFNGTGRSLVWFWIKWAFILLITVGFALPWYFLSVMDWKVRNTSIEE